MKSAAVRLVLAAVLFFGWIGVLVYLAATESQPVVLSRPQLLVSSLDVIAQIDDPKTGTAVIRQVHWPQDENAPKRIAQKLAVANLADCEGWQGPGEYILPLVPEGDGYRVAPLPRSPGFEPDPHSDAGRPRIYRATRQTLRQLGEVQKP